MCFMCFLANSEIIKLAPVLEATSQETVLLTEG